MQLQNTVLNSRERVAMRFFNLEAHWANEMFERVKGQEHTEAMVVHYRDMEQFKEYSNFEDNKAPYVARIAFGRFRGDYKLIKRTKDSAIYYNVFNNKMISVGKETCLSKIMEMVRGMMKFISGR